MEPVTKDFLRRFILKTNKEQEERLKKFVIEQVEGLAQIVARGFAEVHNRINKVEGDVEKIGMITKQELREFRIETNKRFDRVDAASLSHQNQVDCLRDFAGIKNKDLTA